MNTKNKQNKRRKLPIVLAIIGLLLVAGVIAGFIFQDKIKGVVSDIQTNSENQGKPKFVFDTAQFPDWATSGNIWNKSGTVDVTGNEVPVASMNVAQCIAGSHCSKFVEQCRSGKQCDALNRYTIDRCFVSAAYYTDKQIDPDTAVAAKMKRDTSFDGITVQDVGVKALTMNTPEGNKPYQLHYYDIRHGNDTTYKNGNALGYISLSNGYIEIQSTCKEANQLDETLPALEATRLAA